MARAHWAAAERAFNRREPLPEDDAVGQARWSKWSHGGDECHAIEFGWKFRFDIRGGRKTKGVFPDFWYASSRDGSLGEFSTFEAAAKACEDEARRLIEAALAKSDKSFDMSGVEEAWKKYLAHPNRLKSLKTRSRYK